MNTSNSSAFARLLAIIAGIAVFAAPSLANERKVDVWYDGEGNARRVTVVQSNGVTTVVEIDHENTKIWKERLKELGVDISVFGEETLPDTEPLGNAHQLMQYRGFDRSALPEGTYFSPGWGFRHGWGYPAYRFPRGGGHYCRPYHPRGGGWIITF